MFRSFILFLISSFSFSVNFSKLLTFILFFGSSGLIISEIGISGFSISVAAPFDSWKTNFPDSIISFDLSGYVTLTFPFSSTSTCVFSGKLFLFNSFILFLISSFSFSVSFSIFLTFILSFGRIGSIVSAIGFCSKAANICLFLLISSLRFFISKSSPLIFSSISFIFSLNSFSFSSSAFCSSSNFKSFSLRVFISFAVFSLKALLAFFSFSNSSISFLFASIFSWIFAFSSSSALIAWSLLSIAFNLFCFSSMLFWIFLRFSFSASTSSLAFSTSFSCSSFAALSSLTFFSVSGLIFFISSISFSKRSIFLSSSAFLASKFS